MPNLDDVTVGITHVAADLGNVILWLGEELGPLALPLLVAGPDVGDTNMEASWKPRSGSAEDEASRRVCRPLGHRQRSQSASYWQVG